MRRVLCRTGLALLLPALAGAAPPDAPRIGGIAAYLLNSETGRLSEDVSDTPAVLGNVPAGPYSSIQTLVVVRVDLGEGRSLPVGARLRLVATAQGRARRSRLLLDRTVRLWPAGRDGRTHAGFWLDGTGCEVVTLRASLVVQGVAARRSGVLPFTCYE